MEESILGLFASIIIIFMLAIWIIPEINRRIITRIDRRHRRRMTGRK